MLRFPRHFHTQQLLRNRAQSIANIIAAAGSVQKPVEKPDEKPVDSLNSLGKGKKLPPNKQKLIILNAADSKLVRPIPRYFREKNLPNHKTRGPNNSIDTEQIQINNTLHEQRTKLTKINSKITNDQALRQLNHMRPSKSNVSQDRSDQLSKELAQTFTLPQLKNYILQEYPSLTGYKSLPKARLVPKILHDCWGLNISQEVDPKDDLLLTREFDLSQRELYLLLVQRTFDKWIRANVKIVVWPEELRVVVHSSKSHLQYIELALEKILRNIVMNPIEVSQLEGYLAKKNTHGAINGLPLPEIQRLSGVFFEPVEDLDQESVEGEEYRMYSLGGKKFAEAKRLILWSLENNPFVKDLVITSTAEDLGNEVRHYPVYKSDSLSWLYQDINWTRLQLPKTEDFINDPVELDSDKIYDNLIKGNDSSKTQRENVQTVTAVTFGQVLHQLDPKGNTIRSILDTDVPYLKERLQSVPLYQESTNDTSSQEVPDSSLESLDDMELDVDQPLDTSQDYHTYFAQIKCMPSPYQPDGGSTGGTNIKNFLTNPPLEFWFEIDEHKKTKLDTLQAVLINNEQNSTVLLPSHLTDLKFIKSTTTTLIEPSVDQTITSGEESETAAIRKEWLADQPGVKAHLQDMRLDFTGSQVLKVPDFVDVYIPVSDQNNEFTDERRLVRYEYVSLAHRKHLNYSFGDGKRLLQFATVEGGVLGGVTTELIMVDTGEAIPETVTEINKNPETVDQERIKFKGLVKDVTKFVDEFSSFVEKRNSREGEDEVEKFDI